MIILKLALASMLIALSTQIAAQEWIDIGAGVKNVVAMGSGDDAIILVHGRAGNAQSWFRSDYGGFGRIAAESGFKVLSIGWSGTPGQGAEDEIGMAFAYLTKLGVKNISIAGFSAGGGASAMYVRGKPDGTFHSIVQISSVDDKPIFLGKTIKVFAFNRRDGIAFWQQKASKESASPKEIIELPGGGHFIPDLLREKSDLVQAILAKVKQ